MGDDGKKRGSEIGRVIDQVVRDGLAVSLKAAGYRKDGRTFRRADAGCTRVVNVQGSQWNTGDEGRFTVNLGLYVPSLLPFLDTARSTDLPTVPVCLLGDGIGSLTPAGQHHWWIVAAGTDLAALAAEVRDTWERHGAPWMDAHADLPAARGYAVRKGRPYWAAAVSLALGEPDAARTQLAEAVAGWPANSDGAARLLAWGERHGIGPGARA